MRSREGPKSMSKPKRSRRTTGMENEASARKRRQTVVKRKHNSVLTGLLSKSNLALPVNLVGVVAKEASRLPPAQRASRSRAEFKPVQLLNTHPNNKTRVVRVGIKKGYGPTLARMANRENSLFLMHNHGDNLDYIGFYEPAPTRRQAFNLLDRYFVKL